MEFLLEINTEEMPRSHVEGALDQLKTGMETRLVAAGLVKNRGSAGRMEVYGTCRRLILVADVIPRQKDTEEVLIGPPRAAAFTPDGSPGPAALGFARSRGVAVEDLEVITKDKGEYIGVRKVVEGCSARDFLIGAVPDLISRLAFPKMMRWSDNPFRFSRPIKRILCLLDGKILPFRVAGIQSGDRTMGHRLYSPVVFKVSDFKQFNSELRRNKVIISLETRKTRIINQIHKQLDPFEAAHLPDEALLNKLAMDVEYPHVFSGSFPESFLKLPIEVLSTAMREGQNLFSVVKVRKQLPYFVGVADGCSDARGLVRKGNERVLKARLEDARFFWENDLKIPLKQRRADLSNVVFQEKLGSYADKSERIRKLAAYLVGKLAAGRQRREITTAADLCKTDLLTEMVREFPSLQGKAGGIYARKEGFPNVVWKGIYEHYKPASLDDPVPASIGGAILSISDKLDTVVGVMGLGVEISGSKDPFGLRRSAQGVCAVILNKKFNCSLPRLINKAISGYGDRLTLDRDDLRERCMEFFRGRLEHLFERRNYRYDLVHAVLALGVDDIRHAELRVKALDSLKDSPQFEPLIQIARRVNNILRDQPRYRLNPDLFTEKEERELHTTFTIIRDNTAPLFHSGDFIRAQRILIRIRSSLNVFFDRILVMDPDKRIRRNRLALLQEISRLLRQVAEYSQVVIEGDRTV